MPESEAASRSISITSPRDPSGAGWSRDDLRVLIAHLEGLLLLKDTTPPPVGSFVCVRRIVYDPQPNGSVTARLQYLVCDKPCTDPTATCTWIDAMMQIAVPS